MGMNDREQAIHNFFNPHLTHTTMKTTQQKLKEAAAYLGHEVTFTDDDGSLSKGLVVGIEMNNANAAIVEWQVLRGHGPDLSGGIITHYDHDFMMGEGYWQGCTPPNKNMDVSKSDLEAMEVGASGRCLSYDAEDDKWYPTMFTKRIDGMFDIIDTSKEHAGLSWRGDADHLLKRNEYRHLAIN